MTDRNREGDTFERVGESMGEAAGRVAGRMTDAAFSATGAIFNSMTSMLGTWWSSPNAEQAARSFEQREPACREHHHARSSTSGAGSSYERSRPLYQFGHVAGQNPDYQGRSFSEVEPELRRAWETGGTNEHGQWDEVRDYVGYGYGQGTGSPGLSDRDATTGNARDQGGSSRARTDFNDPLGGGGI
jgi:hypothetical protein